MSEIKLKPCPYCGGKAYLYTFEYKSRAYEAVFCNDCGIKGEGFPCGAGGSEELAINAWNTRKPMDRIVEQLMNNFRKVRSDEDLEWNRAIDKSIKIIEEAEATLAERGNSER